MSAKGRPPRPAGSAGHSSSVSKRPRSQSSSSSCSAVAAASGSGCVVKAADGWKRGQIFRIRLHNFLLVFCFL